MPVNLYAIYPSMAWTKPLLKENSVEQKWKLAQGTDSAHIIIFFVCLTESNQNLLRFRLRCISSRHDCRRWRVAFKRWHPCWQPFTFYSDEFWMAPRQVFVFCGRISLSISYYTDLFRLKTLECLWAMWTAHATHLQSNRFAYPLCACRCMDSASAILLYIVNIKCGWAVRHHFIITIFTLSPTIYIEKATRWFLHPVGTHEPHTHTVDVKRNWKKNSCSIDRVQHISWIVRCLVYLVSCSSVYRPIWTWTTPEFQRQAAKAESMPMIIIANKGKRKSSILFQRIMPKRRQTKNKTLPIQTNFTTNETAHKNYKNSKYRSSIELTLIANLCNGKENCDFLFGIQ